MHACNYVYIMKICVICKSMIFCKECEPEVTSELRRLIDAQAEEVKRKETADRTYANLKAARKKQMLIKAERELQQQMKRENLERIKRKQEYHMKETM